MVADVWSTGLSPDTHPVQFVREHLTGQGAVPIEQLYTVEDGRRVLVGGIVTHRQRPATAGGVTFLNLEDETGMLNVICYARAVAAVPQGGPDRQRDADPGHPGAGRRRGQPRRGAPGPPAPAGPHPLPRLPLTAALDRPVP